jgi:hypothetical protein
VDFPAGLAAGDEGVLHLKITTAKEGRTLYQGDIGVAYFNLDDFTDGLDIVLESGGLLLTPDPAAFDPGTLSYTIPAAPHAFYLTVKPGNANADHHAPLIFVDTDGELPDMAGQNKWTIIPRLAPSIVTVQVELPYGAASKTYTFSVDRAGGEAGIVLGPPAPKKTVYHAGDAVPKNSLTVFYSSGAGVGSVNLADDCKIIRDFDEPGPTTVLITYNDSLTGRSLSATFDAWVVGLSDLDITIPGVPPLDLDDFDDSDGDYVYTHDRITVPNTVETLNITATSAVADTEEGASLTITPVPDDETITLAEGFNTITITAGIDKRGDGANFEKETYSFEIYRTPNLYVSGAGASGTAGNDNTGDGSLDKPYATIQKALDKAKTLPLGGIPGAEVAIIVSGTVTAVSGAVTNDSMVDISGSGYPHIILKGAPGGGTIDASLTRRVLYISGNNTVSLGDNLTLTRGNSGGSYGGGVYVSGGGTFIMTGGTIAGNSSRFGGGVAVSGGTFIMSGGLIQGNSTSGFSTSGGGVHVSSVNGSTFAKTGGTIADNTASTGKAVYVTGGKKRDTTADPAVNLYAAYNISTFTWIYGDFPSPPGIGDTTGNWEPYP